MARLDEKEWGYLTSIQPARVSRILIWVVFPPTEIWQVEGVPRGAVVHLPTWMAEKRWLSAANQASRCWLGGMVMAF